MSEHFEPSPAAGPTTGASGAHLDASTLALLAETELDDISVTEFVELLLADDPELPTEWHRTPLLEAARHARNCSDCAPRRASTARAIVDLVTMPLASPGLVAVQVAAALDVIHEPVESTHPNPVERSKRERRSTQRRLGRWFGLGGPGTRNSTSDGGRGHNRGSFDGASNGSNASSGSAWAFARDRRVLLALAAVLAVSVPLLVNNGRRNQPSATKTVVDTTSASSVRKKAAAPVVTESNDSAPLGRADTTGAAGSEVTNETTTPTESRADAGIVNEVGVPAPVPPPAAAASLPATDIAGPAPTTTSLPAQASAASAPPAARAKRFTTTSSLGDASPDGGLAEASADEAVAPTSPFNRGSLGAFPDEDAAFEAFRVVILATNPAARSTSPSTATPTSPSAGPAAAAAAGPAVLAAATGATTSFPSNSASPSVTGTQPVAPDALCGVATLGADTIAQAQIDEAAVVIAAFTSPPPGRIRIFALPDCVLRADRSR